MSTGRDYLTGHSEGRAIMRFWVLCKDPGEKKGEGKDCGTQRVKQTSPSLGKRPAILNSNNLPRGEASTSFALYLCCTATFSHHF